MLIRGLFACGPVIFEQPLAVFDDPKDPTLPELIVSGDHGFRLDPMWQIYKVVRTITLVASEEMWLEAYELMDGLQLKGKTQQARTWKIGNAGIAINDDGSLSLVSCSAK